MKELRTLCLSFHSPTYELTRDQFSEVFLEAIDSWEALYNCLKNEQGNVDIFQALSVLMIFAKSLYIEKAIGKEINSIVYFV